MAAADIALATKPKHDAPPAVETAYLVMDTESVPDGTLLAKVKYPGEELAPEEAVRRAQVEARERSNTGSDFLPVTFQYPISACILRVGTDFTLQKIACLDAPQFRPREIVEQFWRGYAHYRSMHGQRLQLVTFNGRGFDLPLLELSAFRYGCSCKDYYQTRNGRYDKSHIDLMEWLQNFGAFRVVGGMNLFSKLLGKPGKMEVAGDKVYELFLQGKLQEINDYCMHDTLDTYFVFLRTLVMKGEITLEREHMLTMAAKEWITEKSTDCAALRTYLDNWGDWQPWP